MDTTAVNPDEIPNFELTPEEKKQIAKSVEEEEKEKNLKKLGETHSKTVKEFLKDENIIEAFPEEEHLVVEKLEEYWDEARTRFKAVKEIRNIVDNVQADPFSKWFFTNVEKYKEAERLKFLYQAIKRLERLKVAYEKKRVEGLFKFVKFETKEEKKQYNIDKMFQREGLLIDIASFDGMKLRGTGSRFMGLCPFHKEDSPSFAIYNDNWYHCYGCQAHGNFLDYLMKSRKIEFKEALAEANRFL